MGNQGRAAALDTVQYPGFTSADAHGYAEAACDDNAVHLDAEIARQAGFEEPIVHGMLVYAKLEQTARLWCPGRRVRKLAVQFVRPLLQNQRFDVEGRVAKASGEIQVIRAVGRTSDSKPFCIADITVGR